MSASPETTTTTAPPVADAPTVPALGALLTVAEVAGYLRVSEMTVYRMVTAGRIGATKIGRSWRIPAEDLAAYVEDCRIPRAS